ncbi:MAG: C40 family peptidase [Eubacteriales bacterium]|nr:C40 family peptidase [Eubacteriales bacterium]
MKKGVRKVAAVCVAGAMALGSSAMTVGANSISLIDYSDLLEDDDLLVVEPETTAETTAETENTTETEVYSETQENQSITEDTTDAASDETYIDTSSESKVKAPLDPAFNNIAVAYINDGAYVNIRDTASMDGNVVGKIYNNCGADILGEEGDWYLIQSGSVTGYVNKAYFVTGADAEYLSNFVADEVATVNTETLMVRESADNEADVISMVGDSQELEVLGQEGDWVKVAVDADLIGYVSAEYVNCESVFPAAESIEEEQIRIAEEEAARQAAEEAYAQYLAEQEAAYLAAMAQQEAEQAQAEAEYQQYLAEQEAAYLAAMAQQEAEQAQAEAEYQQYLAEQQAEYVESLEQQALDEQAYQEYLEELAYLEYLQQQQQQTEYQEPETDAPIVEVPETEPPIVEVPETEPPIVEEPETEAPPASGTGEQIAAYALQFVGNPYVWGGTSLTDGADCSGFTQSVFAAFGIYLPRTAEEQAYGGGTPVDLGSLQPGDLIFYSDGGYIGHVSIYIGNGQVVHASSPSTGIIVSDRSYRSEASAMRYY